MNVVTYDVNWAKRSGSSRSSRDSRRPADVVAELVVVLEGLKEAGAFWLVQGGHGCIENPLILAVWKGV